MENTSYALYIAAGTLIAVVILSLVVFRWRQLGSLEKSKDEAVLVKNMADFNKEFEAYNKGLMYGTDVLSCLNKAQNNNQKYVYNNYYGTDQATIGSEDRAEYFIDVEIKLNSPLCDKVEAYYKDNKGKYQKLAGGPNISLSGLSESNVKLNFNNKLFSSTGTVKFNIPEINYYYFKQGKLYQENKPYTDIMWSHSGKNSTLYDILTKGVESGKSGQIETQIKDGEYSLLARDEAGKGGDSTQDQISDTARLSALITTVSLKKQTVNNNKETFTNFSGGDWWYCTWTTAASDFKSRKFKCTGTEYNYDTGYIEKLRFEELDN